MVQRVELFSSAFEDSPFEMIASACTGWARDVGLDLRVHAKDTAAARLASRTDRVPALVHLPTDHRLTAQDLIKLPRLHPASIRVFERPLTAPWAISGFGNTRLVHGRGLKSFKWGLRCIASQAGRRRVKLSYGYHPDQHGFLELPPGSLIEPCPVVVLVHGGFWRDNIAADHMTLLAESLVVHGFSVLNLEFRRGAALSSWAESVIDVRDGIAELGRLPDGFKVDPARVAVIGHSSGAHLAHCAVTLGQETLQAEEVQVLGLVSLAGILDLEAAQMQSLGSDSVRQYMGHSEPPADPRSCSPICQMLPSDILLVHGNSDGVVPISMSQRYLQCGAVRAAEIDFLPVDGADHMDLIKPDQSHWSVVLRWLRHRLMNLASSG